MTPVRCPQCSELIELSESGPTRGETTCPRCTASVEFEWFPALARGIESGGSGVLSLPDQASCFSHADKRAEAACDECGRYMCALCEIRVGARKLCPTCFERGSRDVPAARAVRFRILYAHVGVFVALGSLLFVLFAVVGAPIAIGLGVFGLCRPGSITGRRAFVAASVAIVIGLVELLVFGAIWFGLFTK
jgi:hypothetical protein